MMKIKPLPGAYYEEQYVNNGYLITPLPFACLIWGADKDKPIKVVDTLEEAEKVTDNM